MAKALGRTGLIPLGLPHHCSSLKDQDRNLIPELMQKPRSAVYWLALCGLLSPLSFRTQDHLPRVAPPIIGWTLPINHLENALQLDVMETFSQVRFPPFSAFVSTADPLSAKHTNH